MFGRLLSRYTIYTYISGASCPLTEFCQVGYKIHFISKSCVLLYWQRYCTALEKWASAELCGVVQGIELRNFRSSSLSTEGATYISIAAITLDIGPHSSCLSNTLDRLSNQFFPVCLSCVHVCEKIGSGTFTSTIILYRLRPRFGCRQILHSDQNSEIWCVWCFENHKPEVDIRF